MAGSLSLCKLACQLLLESPVSMADPYFLALLVLMGPPYLSVLLVLLGPLTCEPC